MIDLPTSQIRVPKTVYFFVDAVFSTVSSHWMSVRGWNHTATSRPPLTKAATAKHIENPWWGQRPDPKRTLCQRHCFITSQHPPPKKKKKIQANMGGKTYTPFYEEINRPSEVRCHVRRNGADVGRDLNFSTCHSSFMSSPPGSTLGERCVMDGVWKARKFQAPPCLQDRGCLPRFCLFLASPLQHACVQTKP